MVYRFAFDMRQRMKNEIPFRNAALRTAKYIADNKNRLFVKMEPVIAGLPPVRSTENITMNGYRFYALKEDVTNQVIIFDCLSDRK